MAAAESLIATAAQSPHRIDEVTVYREGARVQRVMTVHGGASKEVRFAGLPLGLDDGSVRARVETASDEDGGLSAVDVRVVLEAGEPDAELAEAEDEALNAAHLASDRSKHEVSRLEQALTRLEALKVAPRPQPRDNEPPLAIPLEGRQKLVALRAQESERLAKELADARVASRNSERKLVEEVERHKRATTARNAKRHELRKSVVVRLEGKSKGDASDASEAKVMIEYLVPGARWSPSYALVLQGAKARLTMRALVAQRTGEDWKGARLVLSTANADRWVELPELPKSRIGRAQPHAHKRGYREPPEGAGALYADYDRAMGGPPSEPARPLEDAEEETTPTASITALALAPQGAPAPAASAGPRGFGGGPPTPPPPAAPARSTPAGMIAPAAPRAVSHALGRIAALGSSTTPLPKQAARARREPVAEALAEDDVALLGLAASELETPLRRHAAQPRRDDWTMDAEALAYGHLRMRGPNDASRGELALVATAQIYVEQLGNRLVAGVSVTAILHAAMRNAEIDQGGLPAGHTLAESEDSYDYAYAAEMPALVPSDGAFHTLAVTTYETSSAVRYVAVPREGQQVYRLLDLESPQGGALLAGPIDVYESEGDGGELAYRTTTRMPQTPPRGRVEIGLGVEPAIKVARTTSFQEETAGLLGGSLTLGHRIGVELRNLLPRAITLEVRERVPVVRKDDAEVKVEIGQVEPAWERWDQEQTLRGGHMWMVTLEPGQSRNLSARYTIKISSKLELAGGNRRET